MNRAEKSDLLQVVFGTECSVYASAPTASKSDSPVHVEPGRAIITSEGSIQI